MRANTLSIVEVVVNAVVVLAYAFVTIYVLWNASPLTYLYITIIVVAVIIFIQGLFTLLKRRYVARQSA